jgi:hypothetical protein
MSYTRKPLTATAQCPICPWVRTYFQNDTPQREVKHSAALGQAGHIFSKHSARKHEAAQGKKGK